MHTHGTTQEKDLGVTFSADMKVSLLLRKEIKF